MGTAVERDSAVIVTVDAYASIDAARKRAAGATRASEVITEMARDRQHPPPPPNLCIVFGMLCGDLSIGILTTIRTLWAWCVSHQSESPCMIAKIIWYAAWKRKGISISLETCAMYHVLHWRYDLLAHQQ